MESNYSEPNEFGSEISQSAENSSATPNAGKQGLTASTLKIIAIVAMIIDHIAWAFVPTASVLGIVMHGIGRITGPTMFYFIAEGYRYTRNKNKYTLRLGIFALISWLPFYYFEFGTLPSLYSFSPVGVIYTLFLAHLAVRSRHELKNRFLRILAITAAIGLSFIGDWGIIGVIMVLFFDAFYGNFKKQAIAYSCIVLLITVVPLIGVAGIALSGVDVAEVFGRAQSGFFAEMISTSIIQLGQFIPLILLRFYDGRLGNGGKALKWFFYIIYPVHLLILGILRFVVFA